MAKPANPNLTLRQDLTDFGFGLMQDHQELIDEINFFAPTVPTGTLAGRYAKFHAQQHFTRLNTRRGAGGETRTARWAAEMVDYLLNNDALKIPIDTEIEIPLASSGVTMLERSKLATLMSQGIVSLASTVHEQVRSQVPEHATFGDWTKDNVNPITELWLASLEIYKQTGFFPNRIGMSPLMWYCLTENLQVKADYKQFIPMLDPAMISKRIPGNPEIRILKGAGLEGGFDQENPELKPFMGEGCWIFYANPVKSVDEPAFANILATDPAIFGGVYEYLSDDGVQRWMRMAWNTKPIIRSTMMARRLALKTIPQL